MSEKPFEFAFHEWLIQQRLGTASTIIGIGDDAAVLNWGGSQMVLTTDTLCEGVHFLSNEQSLERIGRKALAVSLSDIAAMGATPVAALVSLALPKNFGTAEAIMIVEGMRRLAEQFGVGIVGGDTNRWSQGLVVGTTVVGTCERPWRLAGARPGDVLITTGPFGGSLSGHHLEFEPRCQIAGELARAYPVGAATDVSDSFSIDLQAMCEASRVGAEVDLEGFPISPACLEAHPDPEVALAHALSDGEDFELLLAVAPEVWENIGDDPAFCQRLQKIGRFINDRGLWLLDRHGTRRELRVSGYEH